MVSPHYSIFRGKAKTGLGESPGSEVGWGEQYLAADAAVYTGPICSEARPWLTLDAANDALAERLEGWSCFPAQGLLFVARMVPARVSFDPRPAYFTHARAFPLSDALGPQDPGAYIGVSSAFDAPWTPEARPPVTGLPPLTLAQPADAEWEIAIRLLGHMYQAFVRKYPVVIAAEPSEFAAGGRLVALAAFARAALPWTIKRTHRIRLYTLEPRLFLRQLGAHVVAVPEDAAAQALEARRDAALLDSKGNVVRGQALSAEARAYAETVRTKVERLPHGLLPFSARVGDHLPSEALPAPHDLVVAQAIYNLAAATPEQMDSLFRFLLTRLSAEAASVIAFDRILRPEEMAAVTDARLTESLLFGADGAPISASAEVLLKCAASAARGRGLSLDKDVDAWAQPLTDAQLRTLLRLLIERLLSNKVFAEKTCALPLARVEKLTSLPAVLEAERKENLLAAREAEVDALVTAAAWDDAVQKVLLDATAGAQLSDRWLLAQIQRVPADRLASIAARVLEHEATAPSPFSNAAKMVLSRLVEVRALSILELRPVLEGAVARTDPATNAGRHLDLLALLDRSGGIPPAAARAFQQGLTRVRDASARRALIERAGAPAAVWVDQSGALLVPTAWDRDIAALVLGRRGIRDSLSFESIARLALHVAPPEPAFDVFIAAADRAIEQNLERATNELVRAGVWLAWRAATRSPSDPKLFARAWLRCAQEERREVPAVEEWQKVLSDLQPRLNESDMEALVAIEPASQHPRAKWLWIAPYQREQVEGLAQLTATLDQILRIAVAIDPEPDLGLRGDPAHNRRQVLHTMLQASPFAGRVRLEVLEWLARAKAGAGSGWPLEPGELRVLLDIAGSLRAHLVDTNVKPPDFAVQEAASWLAEQGGFDRADSAFLARLNTWVEPRADLADVSVARPRPDLAAALRVDFPHLARLVDPPRGSSLYDAVLKALDRGESTSNHFGELNDEIGKWSRDPTRRGEDHPLRKLAEHVRRRTDPAASDVAGQMERAFLNACSWHPSFLEPLSQGAGLPAMELLLVLVPSAEEALLAPSTACPPGAAGAIACRLVAHLISDRGLHSLLGRDDFWSALLSTLERPARRTGVYHHRPLAAAAELVRLTPSLRPWQPTLDAALKRWLHERRSGAPRFPLPSIARTSPKGP